MPECRVQNESDTMPSIPSLELAALSKPKTEPIEIPASARDVKALFWAFPSRDLAREIKDHIREGGEPFTWRGHTHTKPPPNSLPIYIDEFELPKGRLAPCPCCTPVHGKFRDGKIAWFPTEGVIRLIGPHCFRSLDKAHHEAELAAMAQRRKAAADEEFLLQRAGDVPGVIVALKDDLGPIARAADRLHRDVQAVIGRHRLRLWDYARSGTLSVESEEEQDGRTQLVPFATVAGLPFLDPKRRSTAEAVQEAVMLFSQMALGPQWRDRVLRMTEEHRSEAVRLLSRAGQRAVAAYDAVAELKAFLSPVTIGTLASWGSHERCPTSIFVDREEMRLLIGPSQQRAVRITIPGELERVVIRPASRLIPEEIAPPRARHPRPSDRGSPAEILRERALERARLRGKPS